MNVPPRAWWVPALGLAVVSAAVAIDPSIAWLGAWLTLYAGLAAGLFGPAIGAAVAAAAAVALWALPPLVARVLAFEHASVLRPNGEDLEVVAMVPPVIDAGQRMPATSVAGRAATTGIARHVPDARAEAEYVAATGVSPTRSEFVLPLQASARTMAVLHVERERREADLLAEVARRLTATTDPAAAGGASLDQVVDALGLEGGAPFTLGRGRFAAFATTGNLPDDLARLATPGIPWDLGRLHEVWRQGPSVFLDDIALQEDDAFRNLGLRTLALVPIRHDADETLALFAEGTRDREHRWSRRDRRLREAVGHMLGGSLARAIQHARAAELLEAALRLAPAAEAASLLVRGDHTGYVCRAAVGFDLAGLQQTGALSDEAQARWYGEGLEAFRAGRPRLRLGASVAAGSQAAVDHAPARASARTSAARSPKRWPDPSATANRWPWR